MVTKKKPEKVLHRRRAVLRRRRVWTEEDEKREERRKAITDEAIQFLVNLMNDNGSLYENRIEAAKILIGYW